MSVSLARCLCGQFCVGLANFYAQMLYNTSLYVVYVCVYMNVCVCVCTCVNVCVAMLVLCFWHVCKCLFFISVYSMAAIANVLHFIMILSIMANNCVIIFNTSVLLNIEVINDNL